MPQKRRDQRTKRTKPNPWEKSQRLHEGLARQMRKIAGEVGRIVSGFPSLIDDPAQVPGLELALAKYAEILHPWAESVATQTLAYADNVDRRAWVANSQDMSALLKDEIKKAPTGQILARLIRERTIEITSLPIDAGKRVRELVIKARETSGRAKEISEEIQRSEDVTRGRANMIARTETSTAATMLTQARAEYVGSKGYIWRTSQDGDVRPSHKAMQGQYVAWDDPPTLDGMTGHAGCLPNCRCYPEPIIPDIE